MRRSSPPAREIVELRCALQRSPIPPALPLVLLVEDHDEMRSALRDWLLTSFPPLELREARTMDEALRLAEQAALDLALINLELPAGAEACVSKRALRLALQPILAALVKL